MQDLVAELRIFSGIHAGARSALAPGDYVLGTDPSCDLILCDEGIAGRHAELRIRKDGWTLHPLKRGTGDVHLTAGVGVALGPVTIALDVPQAPWRVVEPVLPPEVSAVAEPPASSAGVESLPPAVTSSRVAPPQPNRDFLGYTGFGLALLALLAGLLLILNPEEVPLAMPVVADEPSRQSRLFDIIGGLNLADRVQVIQRTDGHLTVKVAFLNNEEHEQLAAALARFNPRPELKVIGEQELIQEVHDFLQMRGGKLNADYLGEGRFRINGQVAGDGERDALLLALKAGFPAVRGFESALLTSDIIAKQFLDELLRIGATAVNGKWQEGRFIVSAKISSVDMLRWETALLKTEARFGKLFAYRILTEIDERVEARLPFRILGVAGGATPFVVLSDQSKVLLGGSVQGWRLTEIDGNQVVFDGPRRLAVKR